PRPPGHPATLYAVAQSAPFRKNGWPGTMLTRSLNVAFEQALGSKQSLTITYAGAIGRRLFMLEVFAPPNTDNLPSGFQAITNSGSSDYHSLQTLFQRRLSRGLQAMA